MKANISASIIKSVKERGYVFHGNTWYPPGQVAALNIKTVIKIKAIKLPKVDPFINFVKQQLGIDLVPEFRFDKVRKWRFDYAIPECMIAIEKEGGVWSGGRHTRGKGYINDMEKYTACALQGWILIRRTPDQMLTEETLSLIRKALSAK